MLEVGLSAYPGASRQVKKDESIVLIILEVYESFTLSLFD
jgi:hypothetical protein